MDEYSIRDTSATMSMLQIFKDCHQNSGSKIQVELLQKSPHFPPNGGPAKCSKGLLLQKTIGVCSLLGCSRTFGSMVRKWVITQIYLIY